tara:strand:- start:1373 stop:1654 length:282 start_codon:yes stop_codon:yes gene_type:complete
LSIPRLTKILKEKHPDLNKSQLESIINTFFSRIKTALMQKTTVELRGFGTFFLKETKEKYTARNPRTGRLIYVPKKNKIRFRASKKFNKYLNE